MTAAALIAESIAALDTSQVALARALGINDRTMRRMIAGETAASADTMARIAQMLAEANQHTTRRAVIQWLDGRAGGTEWRKP